VLVACDVPVAIARSRDPRVKVLLDTLITAPEIGAVP
jgi:hypothetical protein